MTLLGKPRNRWEDVIKTICKKRVGKLLIAFIRLRIGSSVGIL